MGEAKRKQNGWTKLFAPPSQVRIAISRPGARPASTRKYERGLATTCNADPDKPSLCFNLDCDTELWALPDVYMFLQTDRAALPIGMGLCSRCARYTDDELLALARKQLASQYGLDQHLPANHARAVVTLPAGIQMTVAGVDVFITGRQVPEIGETFVELLGCGKLQKFVSLWRGMSNCHSITAMLWHDLEDAGYASLFTIKRGSCEQLKSAHDPNGLHSWLESDGWAIDVANGAKRPVIIMPTDEYYGLMQLTDVRDTTPSITENSIMPMDPELKALLAAKADPQEIIFAIPENEVWRFASAIVAMTGARAATANRGDVEAVCARFINDLAQITGLPKLGH